jgi:hypothetical protein
MAENESVDHGETRQERREKKLRKRQERIAKHGKGLAQMYKDAVEKRLKK